MAENIGSIYSIIDPNSPILSYYSDFVIDPFKSSPKTPELMADPFSIERGPRYNAYARLRESKLQSKRLKLDEDEKVLEAPKSEFSPAKKSVRFQGIPQSNSKKQGYSVLAQSVPDFSSAVRKENRKPTENRNPRYEKSVTPPPSMSKREKMYGKEAKLGGLGSKSVNSGEKQSNGKLMMGRKSYASFEELKGLSIAASNAINGDNKGGRKGGNLLRKSTVFSTRYY